MAKLKRLGQEADQAQPPASSIEFLTTLADLALLADTWSDVLNRLSGSARQFGGPSAWAYFEVACQRAEQAFVQLEIALREAKLATADDN